MNFAKLTEEVSNKEWLEQIKQEGVLEDKMSIKELERYGDFLKQANEESMFKFKWRINKRKNVYMIVETFPRFYVKIEVTSFFKTGQLSTTVLDKKGYDIKSEYHAEKYIKTVDDFMELIGIDVEEYRESVKMKGY